jgi:hypothetical protein
MREPALEAIERALNEDRELLRMLGMRRTVWAVPFEDAPAILAAASAGVASVERRRNEELVAMLGVADVQTWLRDAEAATLKALRELGGEATAQDLAAVVPALREKVRVNVGKRYEGEVGLSSRILLQLGVEGRIVRARPKGTWVSSQYRWAIPERWLGAPLAVVPTGAAQALLVGRWLARFGPATEADIRWWTGLTAREIRAALAAVGAIGVGLDGGGTGLVLPDDLELTPPVEPWVALLPGLDPTTMGWQARDWYLGPHKAQLFDSTGNGGPAIWVDGRTIGGWAVRRNGEVATKLLEDVGRESVEGVDREAARLTEWLQSVKVAPRFPAPLTKELAGA